MYIDEDLTPLRARMFHALGQDPTLSAVWTIDGRLHCEVSTNSKEQKVVIGSPDDLFLFGWSEEQIKLVYA